MEENDDLNECNNKLLEENDALQRKMQSMLSTRSAQPGKGGAIDQDVQIEVKPHIYPEISFWA